MDIQIVLPAASDDQVSEWLVALTERICAVTGEESGYGLGGRFGYGENYENDTFAMRRYCWCDLEGCAWCAGEAPNFLHKPSGATVHWYKYIGRGMKVSHADWPAIMLDCLKSLPPTTEGGHG